MTYKILNPPCPHKLGQGGSFLKKQLPIFYSALLLTAVNLLLRMVSTSFQVFLSGQIGAAGIGLLQLVMSVGSLAMTAASAGVRTATMYLCAEELGRKHKRTIPWVLRGSFLYSLLFSCTVGVLLNLFAPTIALHWISDMRTAGAIRLLGIFAPISCLCGVMTGYFTAANRIGTLAAIQAGEQIFSIIFTVTALRFWAHADPGKACQSVVLGSGLSSSAALLLLLFLNPSRKEPSAPRIPIRDRLLQAALPLAAADLLKSGINTVENLMVPKRLANYHGTQDPLADFGTVCGMVFPVLMFPAAILFGLAELLIPELARCHAAGSKKRIRYLTTRSLRLALFWGILCCGILYLNAEWLCLHLYGNTQAGMHLRRFSLLAPMLYCDSVTDAMTKGLGQQKNCVRYNILTSTMDVVLLFLLLPHYGMDGYFFSFLITHLLNFILSLRRLCHIARPELSVKTPLLSVLCLILTLWICNFAAGPLLKTASFILILSALLCLSQVLRREDLQWLKGLIAKN